MQTGPQKRQSQTAKHETEAALMMRAQARASAQRRSDTAP